MSVKVIIPSMFQSATGGVTAIELKNCKTVGDCFKELRTQYPPLGKMLFDQGDRISGFLNVMINSQSLNQGNDTFNYPVKDGDEIYALMMIEGG
jgi:molybdopterin converting factor small subunit